MTYGIKILREDGSLQIDDRLQIYQDAVSGSSGYIAAPMTVYIKSYGIPVLAVRGGVGRIVERHHNGSYFDYVTIIGRPDSYAGFSSFEWAVLCTGADIGSGWGMKTYTESGVTAFASTHRTMKIVKSVDVADHTATYKFMNYNYAVNQGGNLLPQKFTMWYGNDQFSYPGITSYYLDTYGYPQIVQNLKLKEAAHSSDAWAVVDGAYSSAESGQYRSGMNGYRANDNPVGGISRGNFIFLTHSYYFKPRPIPGGTPYVPPAKPSVGIGVPSTRGPSIILASGSFLSVDL